MRAAQFLCIWVLAQWTTMDWQWRWGTDCRRDGFAAYTRASLPAAAVDVQTDGLYVRRSVCPVHCGKTADRIIGRTGPGMRQVVRFGDRFTERSTFGGEFGRAIVTKGTLRRTCATAPWRGPLPKLLWANLFGLSQCQCPQFYCHVFCVFIMQRNISCKIYSLLIN